MVSCPCGKASLLFPLSIRRDAVLAVISQTEDEGHLNTEVVGYTTQKTFEAGANSLRVAVDSDSLAPAPGAHLVLVRASGQQGFLPGLAAPRCGGAADDSKLDGLEIVVFGRPDSHYTAFMYLPENVLQELFPMGTSAEIRMLKLLMPVQHDCPPQWLRDRLLHLADKVVTAFSDERTIISPPSDLQIAFESAGLRLDHPGGDPIVGPADKGQRVGKEELGYWNEEMKLNTRCGASPGGDAAQIGLLPSFPGIDGMF